MLTPIFSAFIESAAFVARHLPFGRRARRAVRVRHNIRYDPDSSARAHLLDVWTPKEGQGPWPLLVYVHGGGFSLGSKDSHWWMAARLAAEGLCVAIINYRLAPRHRHPAALCDVAKAWAYLARHAAALGADRARVALMGESAGANLVLALALAQAAAVPPVWLPEGLALHVRAVLPAAGLLDVVEPARFLALTQPPSRAVMARIHAVSRNVLPPHATGHEPALMWASPLRLLEAAADRPQDAPVALARPLPPMAIGVGAADPILDDSLRLAQALKRLGCRHALMPYPQAGHAFFAWPPHPQTAAFWRDTAAFLRQHL